MVRFILASTSPRRKELLKQVIKDFEIAHSSYEEDNTLKMKPSELATHHAVQKAQDVAKRYGEGVIISADTLVFFKDEVMGKPKDDADAKRMLKKVSGKTVDVISGLCVIDIARKKELKGYELTKVKMKKMSNKEIDSYVKSGEPLDKAGAFGIQGKGAVLVEKVDGCYFNVVGLPLFRLGKMMEELGIRFF